MNTRQLRGVIGRRRGMVLLLWVDGDVTALRWEEWLALATGSTSIWRVS